MTTITIGRHPANTHVLTDSTVSAQHAQLLMDEDGQHGRLQDLQSTNGTFVNDTRIESEAVVSLDDKLRFGRYECLVRDLVPQQEPVDAQPESPQEEEEPKTVLTSGLNEHKLIGKSEDCDICLTQEDVSRHHAKLSRTAEGHVLIEDLGSTNGTFVNGQLVTKQVLRKGDKVTITRNYPLDWELIYPVQADAEQLEQQKFGKRRQIWMIVASVALVLALGISGYLLFGQGKDSAAAQQKDVISSVDLYKQYNSAVCMIIAIYQADAYCNGMNIGTFESSAEGTGFFINERGQIGTNQHVARPWLAFPPGGEEQVAIAALGLDMYGIDASEITIRNRRVTECYALLNGDKATEKNLIPLKTTCLTYDNDTDIDVAIMQTKNKRLPEDVAIIDLSTADVSRDALTEGRTIYLIGYPYGSDAALNDRMVIHNQIQEGRITQKRGRIDFGHSIPGTHGASGSPILDDKGHLVGVHYAAIDNVEGMYYGIKVQYLLDLLD